MHGFYNIYVVFNADGNADRCSEEFINGVHYFLSVAEINKRDGFMCCPCAVCNNLT